MAVEMGRVAGVPIQAVATSVRTQREGQSRGHAVAAIKTPRHGIVFADSGRMIPTYTWDTAEALRIYQHLQGAPSFFHLIAEGPRGRPVSYLFTEEGRLVVQHLTAFGVLPRPETARLFRDAPSGADAAVERFRRQALQPRPSR